MDRSPRDKRPLVRAAALVLLVGLLLGVVVGPAACGNDDDSPDNPPPTTPPPNAESEVESAYLAYWEMLQRLSAAPDESDLEIVERAIGQALGEVKEGLASLKSQGRAAQTGPAYQHEVQSVELRGDEAIIRDCSVDDSVVIDVVTGEQVAGGAMATGLLEVTLVRSGGEWKVEKIETIKTWAGERSCDV